MIQLLRALTTGPVGSGPVMNATRRLRDNPPVASGEWLR
jgi:hypothetical protein